MKKIVIVDIDNTIVDQVPRKIKALESLGVNNVGEDVVRQDFGLHSVVHGANRGAFFRIILGPDLQEDLIAFPGASSALIEMKKDYRIIYISARPSSQRTITTALLERLGFPKPNGEEVELALWPLECDIADLTEEQVESRSLEWKRTFVSEYASSEHVVAAISDTSDDVSTFAALGIPSILFHSHGKAEDLRSQIQQKIGNRFISESIQLTSDWERVASLVRSLDSSEEELGELVRTHSSEYASFLGDLDAKARLLLIIATFLSTSFFGVVWHAVSQLNSSLDSVVAILYRVLGVSGGVGLLVCLLAMVFSIRAFGSRHTRGVSAGKFITLGGLPDFFRNFAAILGGKEPCPPGSPIEEAQLAYKEQGRLLRRLTHLAFFQRHYGTYDPVLIRNQRMLDLRAMNYTKIYPEIYARTMLFIGIFMILVSGILVIATMLLN